MQTSSVLAASKPQLFMLLQVFLKSIRRRGVVIEMTSELQDV
jgi:hypothetical protein